MFKYQSILLLLILGYFLSACNSGHEKVSDLLPEPKEIISDSGFTIPVYNFDGLKPILNLEDDRIYLINFWASWCKPCVKELPYFDIIANEFRDEGLKVVLISLDFRAQAEDQLIPFLIDKKVQSEVILLHDPDANKWIPRVDASWTGGIPATIIYSGDRRQFFEGSFDYDELHEVVETFIKNQ